ncbi:MAG: aminotransferase class I/II-fold pyridoxal phosphate-dependent enzyme [Anaerolineaceae bacterium]|nr:aminotransferase class I/II-fold pyridoxal phosphate-dependent enzyme [Anaerolineaceae bacterium]
MPEKLALLGGQPISPTIPTWPVRDEREEQALIEVVRSGVYGGYPEPAPHAARFAADFAEMHDAAYAISCANGTITMTTALLAAGIGWGDEVIVPSITFAATAWAPMSVGAVPIICDIDPKTFCLDAEALESIITDRTRAIIPVHLGATIADLDAIMAVAQKHNLIVIEDCAHAHGGKWRDKGAGSWGHFGSFSMQLTKTLTSGEGGLITTNDALYAETCHSLIDCGRPKDAAEEVYHLGANYRITEFQAALLEVGLTRLLDQQAIRSGNMHYSDERLNNTEGMCPQWVDPRVTRRPGYTYITQFDPSAFNGINSKQFAAALVAEGFPCGTGNPPMHRYDLLQLTDKNSFVYRNFKDRLDFASMHFPVAEKASQSTIWVAHQMFLGGTDLVDSFVEAIEKVRVNSKSLQDYH